LSPGDKLGKYDLIRQIAVGGMAELYLARTVGIEGFEKLVVVKRILPQYLSNASFVNMFLNEARLAATLHHPNIAQVYDIGVEAGDYFFAMEYVHGEDLDRISTTAREQGGGLSLDCALTLVCGLCSGLHYAHDKQGPDGKPLDVVHRDVSPSNVLISYDGGVKLVDFGIARATSRTTQTQGGLKGKIAYMSPEQCKARTTLDRRSDIFSVGTILYELTTGRLPFAGESEYAILNQIVNDDVPPPTKVLAGYPPALEKIVLKALARDPDQRYATALQLQQQLEDFAHEVRLRVSPLVLGKLMSTLFPARLEEWDEAKTQGAFFVEQTVVRTLIESGKTPDPAPAYRAPSGSEGNDSTAITPPPVFDPAPHGKVPAIPPVARPAVATPPKTPPPGRPVPSVATPAKTPPPGRPLPGVAAPPKTPVPARPATPPAGLQRAATPAPAVHEPEPTPTPLPPPPMDPNATIPGVSAPPAAQPLARAPVHTPHVPARTAAPTPGAAGGSPIVAMTPGTLISVNAPPDAIPQRTSNAADITERVRISSRLQTEVVRGRTARRGPVIVVAMVAAIGTGAGVFFVMQNQKATSSTPAASDNKPEGKVEAPPKADEPTKAVADEPAKTEPAPSEAANAEPAKVEAPAKIAEPAKVEPAKAEPAKVEPAKAEPAKIAESPKTEPKKPPPKKVVRRKQPPKTTEPPKEQPWNADSPFMPVRTDKH
jgi:serine/threonine protein kinase